MATVEQRDQAWWKVHAAGGEQECIVGEGLVDDGVGVVEVLKIDGDLLVVDNDVSHGYGHPIPEVVLTVGQFCTAATACQGQHRNTDCRHPPLVHGAAAYLASRTRWGYSQRACIRRPMACSVASRNVATKR